MFDKTGLTASYRFTFHIPPRQTGDADSPSIFTALEEQLGLRLQSAKVPLDVFVIQHAEKPITDQVPQVAIGDAAKDFKPDWQQIGIVADLHTVPCHGLPDRIRLPPLRELVSFVLELDQVASRIVDEKSSCPYRTVVFRILSEPAEAAIRRSMDAIRQQLSPAYLLEFGRGGGNAPEVGFRNIKPLLFQGVFSGCISFGTHRSEVRSNPIDRG